jgi:hypothetical protein
MSREYMALVIRTFIHEKKGVWIDIKEPDTPERERLFEEAFRIAANHFTT